ncbi:MAG: pilus assembly protein TadG-related protein [Pseudomonadota bacterium]
MITRFFGGRFKDNSGQVAVLFALASIPLLALVGFAVDASRLVTAEQHLQRAIDAAALAGSKDVRSGADLEDIEAVVEHIFFANLDTSHSDLECDAPEVTLNPAENSARVTSRCDLPTLFGRTVSGKQMMAVAEAATAKAAYSQLEIAMALDMSQSMVGSKSEQLQTALRRSVNALVDDEDTGTRIAFIPYGISVNAGLYGNKAMGRADHDDRAGDGIDRVCMLYRDGLEMTSDVAPIAGAWVNELRHGANCYLPRLEPLTAGKDTLLDMVENFEADANEYTSTHVGIAWSWFALSPRWHSVWPSASRPKAYSDPNTLKAMILMTDGRLNVNYRTYSNDPAGTFKMLEEAEKAHRLAREVCQAMRDEGILTYVIEFDTKGLPSDPLGTAILINTFGLDPRETLEICAGDPSRHHQPDDEDELIAAYESIVSALKGVALTH